jgi:hypothetical protein
MKQVQKFAVLIFALLLSMAAFASTNKTSVDLTLNHAAIVNGTTLAPGNYKVVLNRDGDNVQANFTQRGKTLASSNGHFEQRTSFPADVSIVVGDGDNAVQQILVQKMKGAVVLEGGTAASSAAASH